MKKAVLLVVFSYIIFFILTPPIQTPDENEHYENIYWVSRNIYPYQPEKHAQKVVQFVDELDHYFDLKMTSPNRNYILPNYSKIQKSGLWKKQFYSQTEEAKFEPITLQSYHPYLYYFSGSILFRLGRFLQLSLLPLYYFTRLISTLYYVGIVYFAYQILKIVIKNQKTALYTWLFFSLNPTVIKTGIGINPDIGMAFFATLLLYVVLKWATKILTYKQIIIIAIISAAAALSKFSGIFTALFSNLVLLINHQKTRRTLINFLIFNLLFLIFISPWLFLNYSRYATLTTRSFYLAESKQVYPRPVLKSAVLAVWEFRHTVMHYSGFMGAGNERYPVKPFFLTYTVAIILLSLIGFIAYLKTKNRYRTIITLYTGSLFCFFYILAFYFKKAGFNWDIQGRFFVSGFFLISLFLVYGISSLLKIKLLRASKIMAVFSLFHYYLILFMVIIPGYYV